MIARKIDCHELGLGHLYEKFGSEWICSVCGEHAQQDAFTLAPSSRDAATDAEPHGDCAGATLVVSEEQIDGMFTSWPLDDKVMCVQAWLDRKQ